MRSGQAKAKQVAQAVMDSTQKECFWVYGVDGSTKGALVAAFEELGCTVAVDDDKLRVVKPADLGA